MIVGEYKCDVMFQHFGYLIAQVVFSLLFYVHFDQRILRVQVDHSFEYIADMVEAIFLVLNGF